VVIYLHAPVRLHNGTWISTGVKELFFLDIYLPPKESTSPITEGVHNVIQNIHALRKQKKIKELSSSSATRFRPLGMFRSPG
jgi:hypothetical protein